MVVRETLMSQTIIRKLKEKETDLLKDFLYEAIFISEGMEPPDRSIINQPELALFIRVSAAGLRTIVLWPR